MILPKRYYGTLNDSDKEWIKSRMRYIPDHKQQEVADHYEHLYTTSKTMARKIANTWLNGVAKEYWSANRAAKH